jgi:hypothetical protein
MLTGLSLLQLIGLALLAGLGLVFSNAIKLILEKEYSSWASGLARLLIWLAGVLDTQRRGQWWADLLYVQRVKSETGLGRGASCLASAHVVAARKVIAGTRRTVWRLQGGGRNRPMKFHPPGSPGDVEERSIRELLEERVYYEVKQGAAGKWFDPPPD